MALISILPLGLAIDEVQEGETVDVIVTLEDNKLSPKAQEFLTEQLIDALPEEEVKVDKEYPNEKSFTAEITQEGLENLQNNPLIDSIVIDKRVHALLDGAT